MKIYHYHGVTGALLGDGIADKNPRDESSPLVPGFATPSVPPRVGERQVAVYRDALGNPPKNWENGSWMVLPDYRGVPLYPTADTPDDANHYSDIGELPSYLTDIPRPSIAHVWVERKWVLDESLETNLQAAKARQTRDSLLSIVDRLINTAEDAGKDASALRQYRHALRNVPQQKKFPKHVDWPALPIGSIVSKADQAALNSLINSQ